MFGVHNWLMEPYEKRVYSQNGEDGILEFLFKHIGTTNKFHFEIGTADGTECNTRYLRERCGFGGVLLDCDHDIPERNLHKEFVTVENCVGLLTKYSIPRLFDLFSLDIDFNDWHVLRALLPHIRPRVLVLEYNASMGALDAVVPYIPNHRFDGTTYFGASLAAMMKLCGIYGYVLVGCDSKGVNAFFVQTELVKHLPEELRNSVGKLEILYRPPGYRPPLNRGQPGHLFDPQKRAMFPCSEFLGGFTVSNTT